MFSFQVFIIIVLLKTTYLIPVADDTAVGSSLKDVCTLHNGNSEINCANIEFIGKKFGVIMKLNTCKEPITTTFRILIGILDVDWSHELESEQEFPIPGFEYNMFGVGGKVFVKTNLYKDEENNVKIKLMLKVELSVGSAPITLPSVTVYDNVIKVNENCGGAGLSGLGTSSKIGIIVCIVLVLLLVIHILILLKIKGYIACCNISQMMSNKPRWRPQNEAKQNGGSAVMKNVNTYETKQHHANKSNIKIPGKKGPQKYKPQVNIKP